MQFCPGYAAAFMIDVTTAHPCVEWTTLGNGRPPKCYLVPPSCNLHFKDCCFNLVIPKAKNVSIDKTCTCGLLSWHTGLLTQNCSVARCRMSMLSTLMAMWSVRNLDDAEFIKRRRFGWDDTTEKHNDGHVLCLPLGVISTVSSPA